MPHMAARHLRHLGAQDFEGPHFRQNGALSPKWTHMPHSVLGPSPNHYDAKGGCHSWMAALWRPRPGVPRMDGFFVGAGGRLVQLQGMHGGAWATLPRGPPTSKTAKYQPK